MRGRRIAAILGAALAVLATLVVVWSIVVVRTCDEDSDVRRGSWPFYLCGINRELVASIPLSDPQGDAVFSWQNADGNKPGRRWLTYSSGASSPELKQQLIQFLKTSGFAPQGSDGEFELWGDGHTVLGFAIQSSDRGAINRVEIVHNTGLD